MKHRLLLLLLFVFTASVAGWAQKSVAPSYTIIRGSFLYNQRCASGFFDAGRGTVCYNQNYKEKCSGESAENGGDRCER